MTRDELGAALATGARHPQIAAAVLVSFGMVVFAGATTVVQALAMPAIALASPSAVALSSSERRRRGPWWSQLTLRP